MALVVQAVSVEQPPAEAVRILNNVAYAHGTYLLYESEPPDASIDFVDIFPGDPRLISQDGQTITIWDSNSREILNQFNIANGDAISAQLITIPNTSYIANANKNNEIIIWDWSTGEKVQTLSDIDISNVNNLQRGNLFGTPSGDTIAIVSDRGGK
ncbi:hypothetical protein [Candidatus Leptofilum sp.]|uniref:hypothetical protein n=1 Tax=Candidatus Leptofilum sp. TaxID=3241576 RepID=UPI003B5CEE3B